MSNVIEAASKFVRPYAPPKGEATDWICIDDRQTAGSRRLYRQSGGAPVGVGHDWAVAMEMKAQKNRGTNMAERGGLLIAPIQILGGVAAKMLLAQENSVRLNLHGHCKAELGAVAVAELSASKDEAVYLRAQKINPNLTSDQFEQVSDVNAAILETSRVLAPQAAATQLEKGGKWQQSATSGLWKMDPVNRVALVGEHVSPYFIADYNRGVAYDVHEAHNPTSGEPLPAYHVSMGDMPKEIAEPLQDIIPFNTDDFLAATAIRHAAISMALELDMDNIHRMDAVAA